MKTAKKGVQSVHPNCRHVTSSNNHNLRKELSKTKSQECGDGEHSNVDPLRPRRRDYKLSPRNLFLSHHNLTKEMTKTMSPECGEGEHSNVDP